MDQQPQEAASDSEPSTMDQPPQESPADPEPSAVAEQPPEESTARPLFRPPRPSAPATKKRLVDMLLSVLIPLVVIALGGGAAGWYFLSKAPATSLTAHPTMPPTVTATAATPVQAPATPPPVNGTPITTADGLQYIDITVGTGATVKEGDTITVNYTGWLQSTSVRFDSSYIDNSGKPAQFALTSDVIKGLVEGIVGMKVGGKRRLIIPPALAYGVQGMPPQIPPDATVIFDIELIAITG